MPFPEPSLPCLLNLFLRITGDPLSTTGESFAPLFRREPGVTRVGRADRVRFTETDLRVFAHHEWGRRRGCDSKAKFEVLRGQPRHGEDEHPRKLHAVLVRLPRSAPDSPTTSSSRRSRLARMRTNTFCWTARPGTGEYFWNDRGRTHPLSVSYGMRWPWSMGTSSNLRRP